MNMIISYFYGDVLLVELINMEVKFTMDITKEILRRATIDGITEYLLYGSAIETKQFQNLWIQQMKWQVMFQKFILHLVCEQV